MHPSFPFQNEIRYWKLARSRTNGHAPCSISQSCKVFTCKRFQNFNEPFQQYCFTLKIGKFFIDCQILIFIPI